MYIEIYGSKLSSFIESDLRANILCFACLSVLLPHLYQHCLDVQDTGYSTRQTRGHEHLRDWGKNWNPPPQSRKDFENARVEAYIQGR